MVCVRVRVCVNVYVVCVSRTDRPNTEIIRRMTGPDTRLLTRSVFVFGGGSGMRAYMFVYHVVHV